MKEYLCPPAIWGKTPGVQWNTVTQIHWEERQGEKLTSVKGLETSPEAAGSIVRKDQVQLESPKTPDQALFPEKLEPCKKSGSARIWKAGRSFVSVGRITSRLSTYLKNNACRCKLERDSRCVLIPNLFVDGDHHQTQGWREGWPHRGSLYLGIDFRTKLEVLHSKCCNNQFRYISNLNMSVHVEGAEKPSLHNVTRVVLFHRRNRKEFMCLNAHSWF